MPAKNVQTDIVTINSTRFGEIEIDKSLLLEFAAPIIGYNSRVFFAVIDNTPDSPFKWLQSVEDPELAFPFTLCEYFDIEYNFTLDDADVELLGIKNAEDAVAINIVNIPHDQPKDATANLVAPIIINTTNNKAMQVILKNTDYKIKHALFDEKN